MIDLLCLLSLAAAVGRAEFSPAPDLPGPALIAPRDGEGFAPTTATVMLSWRAAAGASCYAVRVADRTQPDLRDRRNNCSGEGQYLCLDCLPRTELELVVRPGHAYSWRVHALSLPDKIGGAKPSSFAVSGWPPGAAYGVLQEEIRRQMEAGETRVRELGRLKVLYAEAGSVAELGVLKEKRAILRDEIDAGVRRMSVLIIDFSRLMNGEMLAKSMRALTQVLKRREPGTGKDVFRVIDLDSFMTKAHRAKDAMGVAMTEDQEAWAQARAELARGRRLKRGAGLILAVIAAVLVGAWRIKRRAPRGVPAALPGARAPSGAPPAAVIGGNYRIVRELGAGTLGVTYEAFDVARGERAVIKRIRDEFHRSEKDLERFLAEARRVASLKHQNLAEIFSVFLADERICLAAEYVPGSSLSRELEGGAPLPMRQIKNILSQAAAVVDSAHEQGIVHGDIKPSNILLRTDGAVKVADFGLALLARKIVAKMTWSAAESTAYMAPEQELGETSKSSDVYSLGIIFYQMATGRLPFPGPDFLKQKRETRFAAPGLSRMLGAIVETALKSDPEARFPTASELFAAAVELPDD